MVRAAPVVPVVRAVDLGVVERVDPRAVLVAQVDLAEADVIQVVRVAPALVAPAVLPWRK